MVEILKTDSTPIIAEALEKNLIEQVKYYGNSPLATLYEKEDVVSCVTGMPVSIFNLIVGVKFSETEVENRIKEVLKPFLKYKTRLIWWVGPSSQPLNLGEYLKKNSFDFIFDMPGMYYPLKKLDENTPEKFSVEIVDKNSLLETWAETQTLAFGADPKEDSEIYTFEKSLGTHRKSPWKRFIGYYDNKPVAVAILFLAAGVAAVFNVAVVPEYRRKGLGRTITNAPLLVARSLGYEIGVLKASPMGYKLYLSMDFKECGKISMYSTSI
jgi:ribosomal protein S18 acetylase RimI-like enzyme